MVEPGSVSGSASGSASASGPGLGAGPEAENFSTAAPEIQKLRWL